MKSSTEVSLSGSFAQASATPTEVGFYWGTSSVSMTNKVVSSAYVSGESGDFTADLSALKAGTTYYYQAYVRVAGTESYASDVSEFTGSAASFKTASADPAVDRGWLELPAAARGTGYAVNTYYDGSDRNYTHLYDKNNYASLWTAYPLYASTIGGTRSESWAPNPKFAESEQINIWKGSYGVNVGSTIYARGHLMPDADRSNNALMQTHTYYATNLVPQIQDKFNGGIWMSLENAVRSVIPASDTLYVVTGVTFKTVGGSETVEYIQPQHDTKTCPVPNYFWKVLMKVKRSGGKVTSASTVGFWFEHKQYSDSYTNYVVSVDQIEKLTGFDFFVNLPDTIEPSAETNTDWTAFQNF